MNLYIKPSAMFITAAGSSNLGVSCTTSKSDLQLLGDILGITNWDAAFATGEGCAIEYPVEEYCKYTAVESGATAKILSS